MISYVDCTKIYIINVLAISSYGNMYSCANVLRAAKVLSLVHTLCAAHARSGTYFAVTLPVYEFLPTQSDMRADDAVSDYTELREYAYVIP